MTIDNVGTRIGYSAARWAGRSAAGLPEFRVESLEGECAWNRPGGAFCAIDISPLLVQATRAKPSGQSIRWFRHNGDFQVGVSIPD